jgi:hypothetical protein
MTEQEPGDRKRRPSKRDKRPRGDADAAGNGQGQGAARHERELAEYLQQRIKPGLNRGSIPMLARSIAKAEAESFERELAEYLQQRIKPGLNPGAIPMLARSIAKAIAQREQLNGANAGAEPGDEPLAPADFEAEMHALQAELGEQWILRFSVHGDDAWLTAETGDASQRVEAPTASVLVKAVRLLNRHGGRGS